MTLKRDEGAKDKKIRELEQRVEFLSAANTNLRRHVSSLISRLQKRHDTKDPICLN